MHECEQKNKIYLFWCIRRSGPSIWYCVLVRCNWHLRRMANAVIYKSVLKLYTGVHTAKLHWRRNRMVPRKIFPLRKISAASEKKKVAIASWRDPRHIPVIWTILDNACQRCYLLTLSLGYGWVKASAMNTTWWLPNLLTQLWKILVSKTVNRSSKERFRNSWI